jgi:hypothetical protein
MKKLWRAIASVAVSAGILWLVFREADASAQDVAQALWTMGAGVWAGYAAAQLAQGWLRAVRYRLLLAGAGANRLPGRGRMFGVTLARNMFVDMLPARAGELMYWALLNRGEGVDNEDCASSMTLSVWFDFLALAAVLGFAVGAPMLEAGGRMMLAWGALVVLAAVVAGWLALFHGPGWAVQVIRWLPAGVRRWRLVSWMEGFMGKLAESFGKVKGSGVLWKASGLSVAIRIVKYLGLAVAFYGVARALRPALAGMPIWQVLIGLIGGEGGAALPMPTFMSLGTYEASGAGAMQLAGVPGADAAVLLLGTHVASQIVDYTLGGLGLLGLLWGKRSAPSGAAPARFRINRAMVVALAGICLLSILALGGMALMWQAKQKAGAQEAPGAGTVPGTGSAEKRALAKVWGGQRGFIVWSSTMHGQHDLVRMDWPSGRLSRLTTNPHVDRSPKISPDGQQVVFARSRQEWVSFRNEEEWDIWVLALDSGEERRMAERGTDPAWIADGRAVLFQRAGVGVVQVEVDTGRETVRLASRERERFETPTLHPDGRRLAATLRGKRRGTVLVDLPSGRETPVAGGCQLAFAPGGDWLVLVEDGGRMKNRICRVDRDGGNLETLLDMPEPWSHEYFPRVSNEGSLLVFGAAKEGHEHDTADYEIFLWRIGAPPESAARVSFHTGNDQWPDLHVGPNP